MLEPHPLGWESVAVGTVLALAEIPAILLGLGLLFAAACWCLSPRCRSTWVLMGLSLVGSLTLYAPLLLVRLLGMSPSLIYGVLDDPPKTQLSWVKEASMAHLLALPICLGIYYVFRRLSRRQGDKWFRFEE